MTTTARKLTLDKGQSVTFHVATAEAWTGQYGPNVTYLGTLDGEDVSLLVKADIAAKQVKRNFKLDDPAAIAGRAVRFSKTPEGYLNIDPAGPAAPSRQAKQGYDKGPLIPELDAPYSDGSPSPAADAPAPKADRLVALYAAYRECAMEAAAVLAEATGREDVDPVAVNAGAATLLIARNDRGLL